MAPKARVGYDVKAARHTFHHVRKPIVAGTLAHYRAQRDFYLLAEGGVDPYLYLTECCPPELLEAPGPRALWRCLRLGLAASPAARSAGQEAA
jgi:hypothetical protein